MKNRTLFCLLLTIGFVGFTSCGDDGQKAQLQSENAALHAELARRGQAGNANATVVTTVIATAVANITLTNVNTNSTVQNGTTVVYTVTNSSTATGVRE